MDIRPKHDVPLATHTVFNIGGTARYFYEAGSREDLIAALQWARQYALPFFILGAGSNTLVLERGFSGIVIKPAYTGMELMGNAITADAGAMMPRIASFAAAHHLAGFEWAIGIPGTLGGSVRGNAGCFGKSMADVVETVLAYDAILCREKKFSHRDISFSYRESIFKKHPEYVILSATISLPTGRLQDIHALTREHSLRRVETQAIGEQCAGCIFKNVPWERYSFDARQKILARFPALLRFKNQSHIPAAFVVDELGLKGHSIGQASISKKHANFFINNGGATAHEMAMLISHCKEYVHRKTGILLEEEIQYV